MRPTRWLCVLGALWLASAAGAAGVKIDLERPGDREFVRDLAGLLTEADQKAIKTACDKLLTERATPIIVVTIDSMARHGGAGMRIETFARFLFDQWQIGHAKVNKQAWNTGILLLVSMADRKARIELGAGWGREKDTVCQQIMDGHIIPQFKKGNFSGGIRAGVDGLDAMARGKVPPAPPRPAWVLWAWLIFVGLAIFTGVSLYQSGASGWAWLFWATVFAVVGFILVTMSKSRSSGGFSGGSFGGGFSGGGGASGGW